jgi:ubiquinone/menaquinone biosynthesis C-methylase UbiE
LIAEVLPRFCGELRGQRILDVACGEGMFGRLLTSFGADVHGVDLSPRLIAIARERITCGETYSVDDAQELITIAEGSFDAAICVMALMDIPELSKVYHAVRRAGHRGGWFVAVITHPCFDAPHAGWLEDNPGKARVISEYLNEGRWRSSTGQTIRNRVGAHHRTLATYLNEAFVAGWRVDRLLEPKGGLPGQNPHIPRLLYVRFSAV